MPHLAYVTIIHTCLDIVLHGIVCGRELIRGCGGGIVRRDRVSQSLQTGLDALVAGLELRIHGCVIANVKDGQTIVGRVNLEVLARSLSIGITCSAFLRRLLFPHNNAAEWNMQPTMNTTSVALSPRPFRDVGTTQGTIIVQALSVLWDKSLQIFLRFRDGPNC